MSGVPYRFVNKTPPVNSNDLDAEKFNANNDALSNGTALNDKSIKQGHLDEASFLAAYFIEKFISPSDLALDPASLGLVVNDIVAVNGTGGNVGKLFKVVDVITPVFVSYTSEGISNWTYGTRNETTSRVFRHSFIITGKNGKLSNQYEGSAYYPVTNLDLSTYDQLKIIVTSSSKNFYVRLSGGSIPGGLLELINSPTPGTYTFDLLSLTGLSGVQSFVLEVGVKDPGSISILNETVYISDLIFTSTANKWQAYKLQIINFEVIDKSSDLKYRLEYDLLSGWIWRNINQIDNKVAIDDLDFNAGFLADKLITTADLSATVQVVGAIRKLQIAIAKFKSQVSETDVNPDYLIGKIVQGENVTVSQIEVSGIQYLRLDAKPGVPSISGQVIDPAAEIIDSVPRDTVRAVKWMIVIEDDNAPTNRLYSEVVALCDGVSVVQTNSIGTFSVNSGIIGVSFLVDTDGDGGNMRLKLTISTSGTYNYYISRINI